MLPFSLRRSPIRRSLPVAMLSAMMAGLLASSPAAPAGAQSTKPKPKDAPVRKATAAPSLAREQTADQQVQHVLNRLAFGPRPGDVEAVRALGVDRWIAQQL